MISFSMITNENRENIISSLFDKLSFREKEMVTDIIRSFDFDDEDVEFAVAVFSGCLLVRVFDMGRYLFAFPYEVSENANVRSAIDAITEYAVREELELVFTDVPGESLSVLSGFRHMDIDAEDENAESYRVRIKNECSILTEIPGMERGRVTLNAISCSDIENYAMLCKDKNVNKYWGYDYSDDVASPSDSYFYEVMQEEFARGVSMSLAIRSDGSFCGEVVLYAFDGRGSAEFAIRLLPSYQGRGLGVESLLAAADIAKKIGLTTLRSKVFSKNLPSIAMLKKVADEWIVDGDSLIFTINLN